LHYWLHTKQAKRYFENNAGGSGQRCTLVLDCIKSTPLYLPNLSIQEKIAKVLSDLDNKIELNNRINRELEAMAKTLYDYWFVQFDFPNEQGKPYKVSGGKMVYNAELKREIPEGWEVHSLSSILRHNYSSVSKNKSFQKIEYLDTSSLTKNIIEGTQSLNLNKDKIPSRAQRVVEMNDILYSTVRPNLCHYGLIKHPKKNMIASTGFVQLTSNKDWISNDLIYTYLTSSWVAIRLHQIATLSVSAYPSISPNDILELNIALPRRNKNLEFINSYLGTIYSKISLNQKQNQQLTELRNWLLPMLMNGQVTVKEAEERLSMAAEPSVEYKKG
jgi:type I restriction enzyme S subunit